MFKPNIRLYIILIFILFVLFLAVLIFSNRNRQTKSEKNFTVVTPTTVEISPISGQSVPTLVAPTSTGGNEDVPAGAMNLAVQKQSLKKKVPLKEANFTITYDYNTDNFVVTLVEPKDQSKQVFQTWLSQNYSAIPLNKFVFK